MDTNKEFIWGVSSSSYQIEGAFNEDGRGETIWDVSSKIKGNTFDMHNGDVACDHYHRYKEDVQILKSMGINHYRFSISWTRIFPNGIGEPNEKGIEFYSNLIDELNNNGITPYVTLFCWDYPQALEDMGGWLNDDSPKWFEEYCAYFAKRMDGKIVNYFTINEPQCFVYHGYGLGIKAPYKKLSPLEIFQVSHNVLKANGLGARALRANSTHEVKVGMIMTGIVKMPLVKGQDDQIAYDETFNCPQDGDLFSMSFYCDPVLLGKYNQTFIDHYELNGKFLPTKEDMEIIKCDMDYLGINIYSGDYVTQDENGNAVPVKDSPNMRKNSMGWNVMPESLYYGPKHLQDRYNMPILIMENGIPLKEWKYNGIVNDSCRISFLEEYITEMLKAKADGVDVRGYFVWTFLDNFEWSEGYTQRFGLVYVDYDTQERTIKESGKWYANLIKKGI